MGHMQDQGEDRGDRGDVGGHFPAHRVLQEKHMKK